MRAPVSRLRRSRDELEEEQSSDTPSNSDTSQRSSERKRIRLSDGDKIASTPEGMSSMNGIHTSTSHLQRETLQAQRTRRKHQPGSIVRVKLANFVTYTAVEFFPGPSLNMVIGPNGTGKSTLVCAICLGLGWGPQHLGRAKEVSEYVKHGCQEAMIEIELAKDGKRFKKNIVIRCTIKRDGNKTAFSVNGKPQGKKHVVELARSLAIQIDNLCQFLPQDKVVEFAAMTPIQLLHSTERAVASQEMIDMHEELKDLRRKQKDLQTRVSADQDTLSNLEGRQRLQEADVERMRERESVVKRVEMLDLARPTVHYRVATGKYRSARESRKVAQIEYNTKKAEVEPTIRAATKKKAYKDRVDAVVKDRKTAVQHAERDADRIDRELQALQEKHKELDATVEAQRTASRKNKSEAASIEGKIRELKIQLQHAPPEIDVAAYNDQLRGKQRAWEAAERELQNVKDQMRDLTNRGRDRAGQIQDAERSLQQLDSQAGKQNSKLQNLCYDTAKVWQWVQQHPDAFEKQVFGPPIVTCSIKDPKYMDLIETLFQRSLFLAFTVQTKNDFKTLSDIAHARLRLSEVYIKTITVTLDQFRAPMREENMRSFGFEGWALDYLNGPEPVLAMLCAEAKMHETGVAIRDTTSQQYQMLMDSPISTWVTKTTSYRVSRRREYGPSATSTQTRNVRKATVWTDQPVDLTAKRELQDKISKYQEELDGFKREVQDLKSSEEEQKNIYRMSKMAGKKLADEKAEKQKIMGEFKAIPMKITTCESKLSTKRKLLSDAGQILRAKEDKQDAIAMDRAQLAVKYSEAVEALRVAHNNLLEAEITLIEATSEHTTLEERNASVNQGLKDKEQELEDLNRQCSDAKSIAERMLKKVQDMLKRDDEQQIREFLQTLPPEQTIEELESEIESEKARLELMHEGNGNTIREFEQRRKKIDALASKLTETKDALADLSRGIDTLRSQWEPELDRLVKKISDSFSYNMEQISCAGEVGIWKDEDFEQWTIQIRVKFRENEPLTPLNSHRQSGGERAVSTIFYLMSLQSLTPSPFRVVDEINQGMDPRNERLVHKRMVDIACGGGDDASTSENPNEDDEADGEGEQRRGGSQYFLITPKLLHDLSYARGMQVMCIASGEYMPEDQLRVDFKACVLRMKGVRAERMGIAMNEMTDGGRVGVAAG